MASSNSAAQNDARLRGLCLALPEAEERETWENPTYRVRSKIFAMTRVRDDRLEIWCKGRPGVQVVLTGNAPDRFFVPPYVGGKGWLGIRLDDETDWDEVTELVQERYRMTAPKRLAAVMSTS